MAFYDNMVMMTFCDMILIMTFYDMVLMMTSYGKVACPDILALSILRVKQTICEDNMPRAGPQKRLHATNRPTKKDYMPHTGPQKRQHATNRPTKKTSSQDPAAEAKRHIPLISFTTSTPSGICQQVRPAKEKMSTTYREC